MIIFTSQKAVVDPRSHLHWPNFHQYRSLLKYLTVAQYETVYRTTVNHFHYSAQYLNKSGTEISLPL